MAKKADRKGYCSSRYVVQAWHYAQFEVTSEPGAEEVEVEILDEDDVGCVLVAVRDLPEEAEEAAAEYAASCRPDSESEDPTAQPLITVNIFKVPASGPPSPGEFVKTTYDSASGGTQ